MKRAEKQRSRPRRFARAELWLCALLWGCPKSEAPSQPVQPWPSLPKNAAQAKRFIDQYTRNAPTKPQSAPNAAQIRAALTAAARSGQLVAGWSPIAEALSSTITGSLKAEDARAYLLFGVFHDSAPQIDAFARLAGPMGVEGVQSWALELFDAPGRWAGITGRDSVAEQVLLDRIAASPHLRSPQAQAALRALKKQQARSHYAAWKYDYLQAVVALPGRAKAANQRILACDTPTEIQQRMMDCCGEGGLELRDLHCALTLRAAAPGVVALLWGQAHLRSDRLPRFLPAGAALHRVYVFGARPSEFGAEVALAKTLAISGPLWMPWGRGRSILLLSGPKLQAKVDRVRTEVEDARSEWVLEGPPGVVYLGGQRHALTGAGPWSFTGASGPQVLLYEGEGWALAVGVERPERGRTRLEIEGRRSMRMVVEARP